MADNTPPDSGEDEELARLELIRREKEESWKKAGKQLKGKDCNTLLSAVRACGNSYEFLLQGGCLVPLTELLKKPKAKWAKKNYPKIIESALVVLSEFLGATPEVIEEDGTKDNASIGEEKKDDGPTSEEVSATPVPILPPRHPNTLAILTELAKKKKLCKIKGVDKFVLGLVHKELPIQMLSLRCVDLIVRKAMGVDSNTKVPKGKKQVRERNVNMNGC